MKRCAMRGQSLHPGYKAREKQNGAGLSSGAVLPAPLEAKTRQFGLDATAEATRGLYGESPDFGASTTTIAPILTRL
jgi:hypothetical protein